MHGITLGSTATAIVNMTAVAKQYGAAHRALIVVPLVCGFFIDLVNSLMINFSRRFERGRRSGILRVIFGSASTGFSCGMADPFWSTRTAGV